jgi:hypothetical protein
MDEEGRAPLWTFVWMIVGFKLITSIVIFIMVPTAHSAIFLVGMNWYIILLPIVLVIVPGLFWWRLMRVRAKRRKLIRSEWNVQPDADWNRASARGTMWEL